MELFLDSDHHFSEEQVNSNASECKCKGPCQKSVADFPFFIELRETLLILIFS